MAHAHAIKRALYASHVYRRRLRARPYPGAAVLAYHALRRDSTPADSMPFQQLHVSVSRFEEQCAVLRELCHPLTFDEWNRVASGEIDVPERAALVTFDDGYKTVLTDALPILEKYQIPAIVFLCTQPIEHGRAFWFDSMAAHAGEEAVEDVKARPWSEWRALTAQYERAVPTGALAPLTIDDVRTLAVHPLITIGSHTATHPLLSQAPLDVQHEELERSKAALESWIGRPVTAFAYPNGRPRVDYTGDTVRALAACGFRHGFAVGHRFARYEMSRFEQQRFLMLDGLNGVELAHCLAWSWPRGPEIHP